MKQNALVALATRRLRLFGLVMLVLCVTAPAVPQRREDRRVRVFLLEGLGAVDQMGLDSRLGVEVYRDGKKLQLFPGDELREGDRISAQRQSSQEFFRGASVVIYNDEGAPAFIVGYHKGVDFTLSKLRFDPRSIHTIKVEITNHSTSPLGIENNNQTSYTPGDSVDIYKGDGTRERSLTKAEREAFEIDLDLDNPHQYEARWIRADRLIRAGRTGAAREYKAVASELAGSVTGKSNTCRLDGSWTQDTPGVGSTEWKIASNGDADEKGIGYAKGKARLKDNVLHIDWQTSTGYSGYYEWTLDANCTSGKGQLVFKTGRTDSLKSTVKRN